MSPSDYLAACIVCLGVKHAFDAVYSPGGPSACPACALFSSDRAKVRLEKAQQWCASPAVDTNSDPQPGWLRRQSSQTASASSVSSSSSSVAVLGAPSGAIFAAGIGSVGPLPLAGQGPASQSSSLQMEGPTDEGSDLDLPSFQRPSSDVQVPSPKYVSQAGVGPWTPISFSPS